MMVRGLLLAGLGAALGALPAEAHGTFDQRIAVLNEKLALKPQDPALLFNLAELYCEHEEPAKALAVLEQVKALGADGLPVDYLTGMCLRLAGQPAEALVALNRFVAENPENAPSRLQRARVHNALGNLADGLDDYRAALRLSPRPEPDLVQETADALAHCGRSDEAVQVLDAGLRRLGPIPSLTLRALELEGAIGQFDAALSRVDALQKSAPRPEPWMAKRATVLAKAGRMEEARTAWTALQVHLAALPNLERGSHAMSILAEQARQALGTSGLVPVKTAPVVSSLPAVVASESTDSAGLRFPLRRSFSDNNKHEEVLETLDRQIELTPADASLWFQRAHFLVLDGKWNEAAADCAETDRLAPGRFATDRVRGELLAAQGKHDESKALLDRFISVHPDDGLARAARARLFLKMKPVEAALADFQSALALMPEALPAFYQEVASVLAENGRPAEALGILQAGLARHTGNPALNQQALALEVVTGDFSAALVRLDELQKTAPRPESWMARRAVLLAEAGRPAESRAVWLALQSRIAALPNLERGSADLQALARQAGQALAAH